MSSPRDPSSRSSRKQQTTVSSSPHNISTLSSAPPSPAAASLSLALGQQSRKESRGSASIRTRSDSQASNSSSAISSTGFESGKDSLTGLSTTTFSRTSATDGADALIRSNILYQAARLPLQQQLAHLQLQQQQLQELDELQGHHQQQQLVRPPSQQQQQQQLLSLQRHMSSSSPFSTISSGQRHSSLGGMAAAMGAAGTGAGAYGSPLMSNTSILSGPGGVGGGSTPNSASAAMGAAHFAATVGTPFQPDNNLRSSYLDESGLSPEEYAFYLPALLRLKESPSGLDGLYDEQDALKYLRDECGVEIRDEAMIMALFERTPLGIKPGHFFAWLRLASWAQQGQMPTKTLLFTQTVPVRTHSMRKATGRQTARPALASAMMPPPPAINISNSLGDIRREANFSSPVANPAGQYVASPNGAAPPPPPPPAALTSAKQPPPPPPVVPASRQGQHGRMNSIGGVSTGTGKAMPALPAGVDPNSRATSNPFRDQPSTAPQQQPKALAPGEHPPYVLPPTQTFVLQHAAPALPTPPPPRPPAAGKLPIDALLGFDPAPNPFKQSKPRIVRPTPVVASAAAQVPNPFKTPREHRDRDHHRSGREDRESNRAESVASFEDRGSQYGAGDGTTHTGGAGGLARSVLLGDRLPPPLPPRAPISPLIQAGLHAANEVQRAKQALPPKTYTTLARSATVGSSASSTTAFGRQQPQLAQQPALTAVAGSIPSGAATGVGGGVWRGTVEPPRLLTGEVAPPEVIAPLAQRAAEREAELYGGNPPAPPSSSARRKGSIATSAGQQRRSVSEAATLIRRPSEDEDTKSRGASGTGAAGHVSAHARAASVAAVRANAVYSPEQYGRHTSHEKRLSRFDSEQDDEQAEAAARFARHAFAKGGKSGVPNWLQEQEEFQRAARENSAPSPIPEDVRLELDSLADEMSENAMSAASIERPGNPFTQRSVEPPPPPPIMKDRPLGRSKTLHSKNPPPAPPRKRNESFPVNTAASNQQKAAFKKELSQQKALHQHTPEHPSTVAEDPSEDKSGPTSPVDEKVLQRNGRPASAATKEDRDASRSLVHNVDDHDDDDAVDDDVDDVPDTFHEASNEEIKVDDGDGSGYARLE